MSTHRYNVGVVLAGSSEDAVGSVRFPILVHAIDRYAHRQRPLSVLALIVQLSKAVHK